MAENTFVLKLSDNENIIDCLLELAKAQNIEYGVLVSAAGKIKEFEMLSSSSNAGIDRMLSKEPAEVQAISGKIQKTGKDKFDLNIRMSVTSSGFTPKAGGLVKGIASQGLDIAVRKIDMKKIIES